MVVLGQRDFPRVGFVVGGFRGDHGLRGELVFAGSDIRDGKVAQLGSATFSPGLREKTGQESLSPAL